MYGVGGDKRVCVRTLWPSRGRVRVDSKPMDGRDVSVIRGRQTRAVRWGSGADLFLLICYVRDLCSTVTGCQQTQVLRQDPRPL